MITYPKLFKLHSLSNVRLTWRTVTIVLIATLQFIVVSQAQVPPFTGIIPGPIGLDTSPAILLVITDDGISVKSDPSQPPFDGIEDTLVGVINRSSQTLFSLPLSSPDPIFGFDSDGICTVNPRPPGCPFGSTGYEGPGVSFSSINPAETAGIVNFSGGVAPGASAYFGLELAIQTLCNPISGVPLLKQGCGQSGNCPNVSCPSAPWTCDLYAHDTDYPNTISKWGCNLTACAMLVNYHAAAQGRTFSTTPGALNTWLNGQPDGWTTGNGPNPRAVARYARDVGQVTLVYDGMLDHRDDFVVDNYLCGSDPIILWVSHSGSSSPDHYVLATGQTIVNGTDTFLINDPGYPNPTLAGYNFKYLGAFKYSSTLIPPHALVITGHSPIEMLVTDAAGNRAGFDPTSGKRYSEIPNSGYMLETIVNDDGTGSDTMPEAKILDLPTPADGTYTLTVFGTGTGPFRLDFTSYDSHGNATFASSSGNARQGSSINYRVDYSSVSGSQVKVTPIDTNPPSIFGMPTNEIVLWPPNHKFVTVGTVTATDAESGVATFDVTGTSNESMDPSDPDIVITGAGIGPRTVQLRAERLGTGAGRIYTITATAVDVAGNSKTISSICVVPHDQSP